MPAALRASPPFNGAKLDNKHKRFSAASHTGLASHSRQDLSANGDDGRRPLGVLPDAGEFEFNATNRRAGPHTRRARAAVNTRARGALRDVFVA